MSSIIAGKYKGYKIKINNLKNVRPTLARVKKSIFQILEPIENKKILDLYSGTGSIGLEFLSRGASNVTMIERSRKMGSILNKNISHIHLDDNYNVICNDAIKFLKKNTETYDIIFADPPYNTIEFNDLHQRIEPSLANNGIFCMEMKKKTIIGTTLDIRVYGNTQIILWEANE